MVTDALPRTNRGLRTVATVAAAGLRVLGIVLLGASAVLGAQASWSRFGVCFGAAPSVPLPAHQQEWWCELMQDHQYDYDVPADPWLPIADAAQREGLSLVALGLGVALVALSLTGRWFVRLLSVVGGVGFAAAWVGMGLPVRRSGLAGAPVGMEGWVVASSWSLLALLGTAGLAVLVWFHGGRDRRPLVVLWVALTLAHPLPEYFLAGTLWGSHDTSPLTGTFRSAMVVVAAVAVAVTLVPPDRRPRLRRVPPRR